MEQEKFKYIINGKMYIQKPLVLGQVNQIMAVIKGVKLPEMMDALTIIAAFGNKMPAVLAIVLQEERPLQPVPENGFIYLRDRNIAELAEELEFAGDCDLKLMTQVIEDFFDCNPIASLFERFAALGKKLMAEKETEKASSTASHVSSPAETSPGATPSSGDSPSPKPAPTSSTAPAT